MLEQDGSTCQWIFLGSSCQTAFVSKAPFKLNPECLALLRGMVYCEYRLGLGLSWPIIFNGSIVALETLVEPQRAAAPSDLLPPRDLRGKHDHTITRGGDQQGTPSGECSWDQGYFSRNPLMFNDKPRGQWLSTVMDTISCMVIIF